MAEYIAPKFRADGFNCPHCRVYAHQKWDRIIMWQIPSKLKGMPFVNLSDPEPKINPPHGIAIDKPSEITSEDQLEAHSSVCSKCHKYALWVGGTLVYPPSSSAPLPAEDMPEGVKEDYLEARKIVDLSPRSAESLLRLALQKLMPYLGEGGRDLNEDIGQLVAKGLPEVIQKSLDSIRVTGNNAVHPGKMILENDMNTALTLFKLMNIIVEKMISEKKELDELYSKLPEGAIKQIDKRNRLSDS
jgi:hypothetical protein